MFLPEFFSADHVIQESGLVTEETRSRSNQEVLKNAIIGGSWRQHAASKRTSKITLQRLDSVHLNSPLLK
jgi:hypothetical protein